MSTNWRREARGRVKEAGGRERWAWGGVRPSCGGRRGAGGQEWGAPKAEVPGTRRGTRRGGGSPASGAAGGQRGRRVACLSSPGLPRPPCPLSLAGGSRRVSCGLFVWLFVCLLCPTAQEATSLHYGADGRCGGGGTLKAFWQKEATWLALQPSASPGMVWEWASR
jgi:hypothetical protein